ncbi:MAG: hypothetical protein WCW93_02750 [Candidatus Paceibacterota bacterium]
MNDFERFPIGKKRKEVIIQNQAKIKCFEAGKKGKKDYSWLDSPLDEDFHSIGGESFAKSFYYILPESNKNMKSYVQECLKKKEGEAVGVEFGGIGSNVFKSFSSGFFAQSIGVDLIDHRKRKDLVQSKKEDKKINHEILKGDIFDLKTYESLDKLLEGKKVDFIVSRMGRGLEFVPIEPYTVSKILKIWYELLAEEGVMFVQTPVAFNKLLRDWTEKIEKEYKNLIEISFVPGFADNRADHCSSFRLRKLRGAPAELPLLDPRSVKKSFIYKK